MLLDWTSFISKGFPVELFPSLSMMRCLEGLFNVLILIAKRLIEKSLKINLQSGDDTNNSALTTANQSNFSVIDHLYIQNTCFPLTAT